MCACGTSSRRHKDLEALITVGRRLLQAEADVATARAMLADASPEDRELVRPEIEEAEASTWRASKRSSASFWCRATPTTGATSSSRSGGPKGARKRTSSPGTSSRCTAAMRSAAGGSSTSSRRIPPSATVLNEVTFVLKGSDAWTRTKHEGGTHRVQRVPVTESQGRIHTSAATVLVLPEADEVEVHVDPADLRVDVFRSTGPGGQSVNTTDSAVRITHVPTGIVVSMQDEKSQIQNRARAMQVLRARLLKLEQDRIEAEQSEQRRSQVGGGGRSEKIRTYNFKENRVTDHRVKLTLHKLDRVLDGDLDEIVDALLADERERQLGEGGAASGS